MLESLPKHFYIYYPVLGRIHNCITVIRDLPIAGDEVGGKARV